MKCWGNIITALMVSCAWNAGFGEERLFHVKKPEESMRFTMAESISADGSTVVGDTREGSIWEAFRWNPNKSGEPFVILDLMAGKTSTGSVANDVTADGEIIVGEGNWEGATYQYPKIWINDTFVEYEVDFGSSQYYGGAAYAISDDGTIIATRDIIPSPFKPTWEIPVAHWWNFSTATPPDYDPAVPPAADDFVALPIYDPPGTWPPTEFTGSGPLNISGDGSVLVGESQFHTSPIAVQWFRETGGNWLVMAFGEWDDNRSSSAVAASYSGDYIVGNMRFNFGTENDPYEEWRGFVWNASTGDLTILQPLTFDVDPPVTVFTEAFDISGDGETIVGRAGYGNITESVAVYWDITGRVYRFEDMVDESMRAGWDFEGIAAVNDDGSSMAGFGTYNGNLAQTWHLYKAYNDAYADSADIGENWYIHSAMGIFWRAGRSHVWHTQHGWQKMAKGKHEIRLFDFGSDSWIWSSEANYPFMYRYGANPGWVYYKEGGSPGNRVFYHFGHERWMTEQELAVSD